MYREDKNSFLSAAAFEENNPQHGQLATHPPLSWCVCKSLSLTLLTMTIDNFHQKKTATIWKYIYNRGQNEKKKKIITKWCQAFPAAHANWSSQKLWLITSSIFAASPCKAIELFLYSINFCHRTNRIKWFCILICRTLTSHPIAVTTKFIWILLIWLKQDSTTRSSIAMHS